MRRILAGIFAAGLLLAAGVAKADYREFILAASNAVTATGNGATVDTRVYDLSYDSPGARLLVDVTAVSGTTPSATFSLQSVVNGIVFTMGSCTALTAVGQCSISVDQVPTNVRIQYAISGTTPSFTFSAYLVRQ